MKNKIVTAFLVLGLFALVGCQNTDISTTITNETITTTATPMVRPHTHVYEDYEIITEATLFNKGTRKSKCTRCHEELVEDYYYFDEVVFENTVYQFNNQAHFLNVKGLVPSGISVEYEDNSRTALGTSIAKAHFVDEEKNIVKTLEAALIITNKIGLPNISINTTSLSPIDSKETYTTAAISVGNCDSEHMFTDIAGGVRLRGNGSLEASKKPYRIKFDQKRNVLGLNDNLKAKSWVLLAEYYDYSIFRNATALMMGDALFNNCDSYYSSDFAFVNVLINGVYNGIYLLAEQSQVNNGRVDIYEPNVNDTSLNIGYLVEIDQYARNEGDYFIVNGIGLKSDYYSLKSDYYSNAQKEHISKYMNSVYEILYKAAKLNQYYKLDENFDLVPSNASTCFDAINEVIDVDSFIRSYILEEIMRDIDVGFSSYYMYVDFSPFSSVKRLTTSVPWDFDWSSGNVSFSVSPSINPVSTTGKYNSMVFDKTNVWLYLISQCDFFQPMMEDYYTIFRDSGIMEQIYDYQNYVSSTFQDEFANNFRKWQVLGTSQHIYHSSAMISVSSHSAAVTKLQLWLRDRIAYLDSIYYKGEVY